MPSKKLFSLSFYVLLQYGPFPASFLFLCNTFLFLYLQLRKHFRRVVKLAAIIIVLCILKELRSHRFHFEQM